MSADEELLEPMLPVLSKSHDLTTGGTTHLTMKCVPEKEVLPLTAVSSFFINANIKAPVTSNSTKAPMDLVCVLDNSGSMQGGKIECLKEASKFNYL
jgi:hypothetical protein